MKAVVYDKKNPGDRLVFREVEKPLPSDDEVLVKVRAVSVNAYDLRTMKLGMIPERRIFGADIAGRIETVGKDIKSLHAGDEVFGNIAPYGSGGFAEYVAVPEKALSLKPAGLSFEEAAAIPMASVTALQALRDKGGIEPRQKVLICGAGGGVGTFAVQLAKYFGAEVTAVCGERNGQLVQSLGADRVIDYLKEDFSKSGNRYDLILAVNGCRSLLGFRRVLAPGGTCVHVGGAIWQFVGFWLLGPVLSFGGRKMTYLVAKASKTDLEYIIKLVEEGRVKPIVDRRYPLAETAEAVRYVGQGHARGKVVVDVGA